MRSLTPTAMLRLAPAVAALLAAAAAAAPAAEPTEPAAHAVEFSQRLGHTDPDDAQAVLDLADWADRSGLGYQAARLYRRVLHLRPDHHRAYERLVAIADTTPIPENEQLQRRLPEQFGPGFSLHVSPHFLVVYNTDRIFAVNRAVLLEKTHDVYFRAFRRAGLRPLPLTHRLVCVLFEDHEQFARYAQQVDRLNMDWSGGYYSARTNRIAFYNDRSSPAFEQVRRQIEQLERQVADLAEQFERAARSGNVALAEGHRRRLRAARAELNRYRNRHEALAGLGNASKTTHEAVHQLAFNTALQNRGVMYPFWLSEGLATSFETTDPAADFGPYHTNTPRRKLLIRANRAGLLAPLSELLGTHRPPADDPQQASVLYAQSWALFQFLFKHHSEDMRRYLRSLADLPPGRRDGRQLLREFEQAFGSIDAVQQRWERHLRRLR